MWHGVSFSTIGLAGAVCAAIAIIVGMGLQAGFFHRFHGSTPNTWRASGPRRLAMGAAARILVGAGFPLLYIYTGMGESQEAKLEWVIIGLKFGGLVWLGVALPQTLSTASFVNVHKGVVAGLVLDWLIVCLLCGLACTKILQHGGW